MWLYLGLCCGALVLCCGGSIGGIGFYVYNKEPPEQTILGTWQLDRAASSYNPLVQKMPNGITLELRKDNTYRMVLDGAAQKAIKKPR